MRHGSLVCHSIGLAILASSALATTPTLYRTPTVNRTEVAFAYAGDLWLVSREDGAARRLTSGIGIESDPAFFPNGTVVDFTDKAEHLLAGRSIAGRAVETGDAVTITAVVTGGADSGLAVVVGVAGAVCTVACNTA